MRIASGPDKGKMMYTPLKNGKERTITLTVTALNVLREAKRKQNEMHLRAGSSWHNEYNMISPARTVCLSASRRCTSISRRL